MKKTLSIILALVLSIGMLAGCAGVTETEESGKKAICPLPETLDINALDNCTVAVLLEKGNVYLNDSGKLTMKAKVYSYELFDMVDIASLKEGSIIECHGEAIEVEKIERLESGLVRINGGEENGGFDLISDDNTVYYEVGMNDAKNYYELGEVSLPVSTEFVYYDRSDVSADAKEYYSVDFLTASANIEYDFTPYNTSIVIENGSVIEMNKVYIP